MKTVMAILILLAAKAAFAGSSRVVCQSQTDQSISTEVQSRVSTS